MGRFRSFLNNYSPFVTRAKAQQIATIAAERARMDERGWDTHKRTAKNDAAIIESDDSFYLYENEDPAFVESIIKEGKISKDQLRKVAESFSGGAIDGMRRVRYYQTLEELWMMQDIVNKKYHTDPHCKSIIDNWVAYTMGRGMKLNIDNPKVDEWIAQFRKINKMATREKDFARAIFKDGELFVAYYYNSNTGHYKIRRIRPREIVDIETHPEDVETLFSYHWQYEQSYIGSEQAYNHDMWIQDIDYEDYKKEGGYFADKSSKHTAEKNMLIQFMKFKTDLEIRGRVPLQPVLRYIKYYEDWLIDRVRLNHERAKVVWIKEIRGRTGETTKRARKAPKGGVMLVETENVKYRIESSKLSANDAKEDGLHILYAVGAGTFLPLHILEQRGDRQVYASIKKSDTPFAQAIEAFRGFFAENFEKMYRQAIQGAVKARKLPETVEVPDYTAEQIVEVFDLINKKVVESESIEDASIEEIVEAVKATKKDKIKKKTIKTIDVPLGIEFPEVIREDPKLQAQVFQIHQQMGIASMTTLAAKAGYNWRVELANMIKEKEALDEAGISLPEPVKGNSSPDNLDKSGNSDNPPSNDNNPPNDQTKGGNNAKN